MLNPIPADSLKATNNTVIPSGYKTGIHTFGSDVAANLNNTLYMWNSAAPAVFVYFKADQATAGTTGSNFTAGTLMLTVGAGVAVGALVTFLCAKAAGKKKENKAATA